MRNVTVSIPDEVYRQARVRAAQLDTSLSAMVRGYLLRIAGDEANFERLRRLQDEVLASIPGFRAGDRLDRDQVHDRASLR